MITLPGQLAIKTIHGRNGDFNVGRLTTSIGEFVTKNAELDQYREGKYDGEFIITKIYSKSWSTGSHIGIDTRADLGGMTLSNLDALTKDEAHRLSPQEVDPLDEEAAKPQPVTAAPSEPIPVVTPPSPDPLVDTTPFGDEPPSSSPAESDGATQADAALFGAVWPLGQIVKLDPTVDRRLLRKQRDRLDALGYDFDYASQNWNLKAA